MVKVIDISNGDIYDIPLRPHREKKSRLYANRDQVTFSEDAQNRSTRARFPAVLKLSELLPPKEGTAVAAAAAAAD